MFTLRYSMVAVSAALCAQLYSTAALSGVPQEEKNDETDTPIEHVIVIVGENHSFDNIYGAYKAPPGQRIANLLSKGIINGDGTPGPNFSRAAQRQAENDYGVNYSLSPGNKTPYQFLPPPNTTYATDLPFGKDDTRYPANLPNGPFQLTNTNAPYDPAPAKTYFGDPVHRFFQMWQMTDKGKKDLFTWVGITAQIGSQNSGSNTPTDPQQGGEAMGFYNINSGDAPIFKKLAHEYAISDNYHQFIMGGTGANFIALVTGDVGFYTQNGLPAKPPITQIENPNPSTDLSIFNSDNNWYTQDGYSGGSYVNCHDYRQPGVKAIRHFIGHSQVFNDGNCAKDTYYLVNNYGLAYDAEGNLKPFDPAATPPKTILPPQTIPTIADALSAKNIAWKYYTGGRNGDPDPSEYCGICDPLTGFTSIMATDLKQNLQPIATFNADVANSTLPAVSYVRPYESKAGHPANATLPDFESYISEVIAKVKANPALWKKTAILITMDEGGGYYDSNYIQPIDFFGDGTRIPLLVVSPWAKKGHISHSYGDHASILKFIEKNWDLDPLSKRSRDNLPNPVASEKNPYIPVNQPAISNLMGLFDFSKVHHSEKD